MRVLLVEMVRYLHMLGKRERLLRRRGLYCSPCLYVEGDLAAEEMGVSLPPKNADAPGKADLPVLRSRRRRN